MKRLSDVLSEIFAILPCIFVDQFHCLRNNFMMRTCRDEAMSQPVLYQLLAFFDRPIRRDQHKLATINFAK
jgi:hypothetical protein